MRKKILIADWKPLLTGDDLHNKYTDPAYNEQFDAQNCARRCRVFVVTGLFTGRNEVLAKVIFLHLSVILFTGGGVCSKFSGVCVCSKCLGGVCSKLGGVCSKFSGGVSASNFRGWVSAPNFGGGCLLQIFGGGVCSNFRNTVNVRPVRILLECILVNIVIKETALVV